MKKLFLTGISLLFAVALTFAQNVGPEEKARAKSAELTEKLQLTPEQQGPVHQIILEGVQEKHALKADQTLTEEAKKDRLKAGKKEKHEKLKALLTDEQKTQYEAWVKEQKED
ncbi:hypothetical protein M8998_14965 [Sphingobacterium sp. lm-10]|uniref:hypothetical protein n=1 Tax=Sphingobacterium sp. lm-10 TaxID=2944904 RepID=UPI00202255A1|nr:hypothetical protein [Sphingobacterium sp. lm-10]MCL7989249.1 hypothetical protein [Sphingobacterium sp. lm-10]